MKLCMPTLTADGINSELSNHFGSAPFFTIADSETLQCRSLKNENQHHSHGMCEPLKALQSEEFDGIIVGGIGRGALMKLQSQNIEVFRTTCLTVKDTIAAFNAGELKAFTLNDSCAGHSH